MLFWLVFRDILEVNHTCKLLLLFWNIKKFVWFCPVQTKHKFTLTSSFCEAVRGDSDAHFLFLSFSHQRGEADLRSCQDPALTSDSGWSTHATQEQKDFHGASPHHQSEFCSQEHFLSDPSDLSSWPSHVGDGRWVHLIHASGQDDQGALLRHLAIWWYIVHTLCHTLVFVSAGWLMSKKLLHLLQSAKKLRNFFENVPSNCTKNTSPNGTSLLPKSIIYKT